MRINFQLIIASIFAIQIGFGAFAQKFIVNSAAKLINDYNPSDSISDSKNLLKKAKDFIDIAAVNTETAESSEMHMYRGKIYYGLIEVATKESVSIGTKPDDAQLKEYEAIAKASFSKVLADPKKKYIPEIQIFIGKRSEDDFNLAVKSYQSRNYEMATKLFVSTIKIKSFLNEKYSDAEINAQLCLSRTVDSLLIIKSFDKALELANVVNEAVPSNINVLILFVNIYLQKGDVVGSQKYLNEALALDPNNKQLYYVLGTAYMSLKENEKAEIALTKALEIDPAYNNAQYQLGAHLYNWAADLKKEAGQLPENDASYEPLMEKATAMQYRSLELLEKYIAVNPLDKTVLEILRSTYSKLGNNEKASEYKKRIEALKN